MAEAVTITADLLDVRSAPSLSTTSDRPSLEEPVAATPEPAADPVSEPEASAEVEEAEAAPPSEAVGDPDPKAPKTPKAGINERFSEMTAQRKAAESDAAAARAEAAEAKRLLQEALARIPKTDGEPVEVPPPVIEPRPQRETFDTPEAYDEALIEWSTKKTLQAAETERVQHAKAQREEQQRSAAAKAESDSIAAMQTQYTENRTKALEKYPDYAEVAEGDHWQPSIPMSLAIMRHADGPDVAHYLGKNPEIAKKIAALVVPGQVFPEGNPMAGQPVPDVQAQLIEMGKVFATVAAQNAAPPAPPAPKEPPPPPAPINPLRRGNNAAVQKSLEDIGAEGSVEEYALARARGSDQTARAVAARLNHGAVTSPPLLSRAN
jgi:hypothetical protein